MYCGGISSYAELNLTKVDMEWYDLKKEREANEELIKRRSFDSNRTVYHGGGYNEEGRLLCGGAYDAKGVWWGSETVMLAVSKMRADPIKTYGNPSYPVSKLRLKIKTPKP